MFKLVKSRLLKSKLSNSLPIKGMLLFLFPCKSILSFMVEFAMFALFVEFSVSILMFNMLAGVILLMLALFEGFVFLVGCINCCGCEICCDAVDG